MFMKTVNFASKSLAAHACIASVISTQFTILWTLAKVWTVEGFGFIPYVLIS